MTSIDVADSVSAANRRVESDVSSPSASRTSTAESVAAASTCSRVRTRFRTLVSSLPVTVSIARTIVHDPPVLIFDEPTSGLDVLVARAVLKTIALLKSQGKCIIFSTHIMREVEKLCDRVGIIHKGRILALGTLHELEAEYGQPDMEELFFELIQRHDEREAA